MRCARGWRRWKALGSDHEQFLLAPEDGTPDEPLARIAFEKAGIAKRGVPLKVVDVPAELARDLYPHKLALIRPDQHIAWRSDAEPADPMGLIDLIRGAAVTAARKAA